MTRSRSGSSSIPPSPSTPRSSPSLLSALASASNCSEATSSSPLPSSSSSSCGRSRATSPSVTASSLTTLSSSVPVAAVAVLCGFVTRVVAITVGIVRVGGGACCIVCCIVCSLGQRHRRFVCPGFGFGWRRIGVSSSIGDGGIVTTNLKIVGRHGLGRDEIAVLIDGEIDVRLIALRVHSRRSLAAAIPLSTATPARIGAVVQKRWRRSSTFSSTSRSSASRSATGSW